MEFFILVNYTDKKVIGINSDFSLINGALNYYLNKKGHKALIPGLLQGEIKIRKLVEVQAGEQLLAVALKNAVKY